MYGELGYWRNGSWTSRCEENREVCLATRIQRKASGELIPAERIEGRILLIRGHKVLLDRHLAELYGVTTGNLNKAVDRNEERFPDDFSFRLNPNEYDDLKFHFGTSKLTTDFTDYTDSIFLTRRREREFSPRRTRRARRTFLTRLTGFQGTGFRIQGLGFRKQQQNILQG